MLAEFVSDGMPSISVRKLDEKTVAALRNRAARRGVSMEEEVRRILQQVAGESDLGELMDQIFARSRAASKGEPFLVPEYDDAPEPPIEFE